MYPWLPWLYCCLSCAADAIKVLREKWVGKGCNCQRKHHMQVLSSWTGCRNRPENSQSDSNLFYKDLISCHWTSTMNVRGHRVRVFQLRFSTSRLKVCYQKKAKCNIKCLSHSIGLRLIQRVINDESGKSCMNWGGKGGKGAYWEKIMYVKIQTVYRSLIGFNESDNLLNHLKQWIICFNVLSHRLYYGHVCFDMFWFSLLMHCVPPIQECSYEPKEA